MGEWIPAGIASGVTAFFTYLVARRKSSGRIDVSEAKQLWEEANKFRAGLQEEIERLKLEVLRLRRDNHQLRNDILKWQLATAANVPDDIKLSLLEASERHIQELQDALQRSRDFQEGA